jgi:hypothetical protein
MAADILEHIEVIEECYEFMLAYAAQGLASDTGSESGRQIREFLNRAVNALIELPGRCAQAMRDDRPKFLDVLERDASDSLAALEFVLAQRSISSQLIDNLNASVHLRALLTDVFLLGEVLRAQQFATQAAGS